MDESRCAMLASGPKMARSGLGAGEGRPTVTCRALPSFEFSPGRLVFGRNSVERLPSLVTEYLEENRGSSSSVFIVCGSTNRVSEPVAKALREKGVGRIEIFNVAKEPTVEVVREATKRASGCGVVVSIGGGAAIDTGKAVSVLLTNGGEDPDPLDFLEVVGRGLPIERPGVPYIACPTTAGVGSEVTKNAVLGAGPQKVSMRSPFLIPSIAVVDPLLTVTCPKTTTAYTGLDALVQCIEPYCTHLATPLSDLYARQGVVYGARSLRAAFDDPEDLEARDEMSLCGLFSGIALANSKLGSVHGFAGVLGGMFPKAPHGAICGRLLPPCWRANFEACRSEVRAGPDP